MLAVMCAVAAAVRVFAASNVTVGSTANNGTSGTISVIGAEIAIAPAFGNCISLPSDAYGSTAVSPALNTVDLQFQGSASLAGAYCVRLSNFDEVGKTQFAYTVKNVAAAEVLCSAGEGEAEAAGGGDGVSGAGDCGTVGELQSQVQWATSSGVTAIPGQCSAPTVASGITNYSPLPALGTGTSLQSAVVDHSTSGTTISDPGVFCVDLLLRTNATSNTAAEAQTDTVTFDADIVITNPVP